MDLATEDHSCGGDVDPEAVLATFAVGGQRYQGTVVEATHRDLRIRFDDAGTARAVPVDVDLALTLNGGSLDARLEVVGRVIFWRIENDGTEFVLVELPEEQIAAVRAALRAHRSIRIPVRGDSAVRVRVESCGGEETVEAAMIDISESGIGLIMSTKDDQRLAAAVNREPIDTPWLVEVSFRLPGSGQDMVMIAEIRYRMWVRNCVKYGVRFDKARTQEAFPTQRQSICNQMMAYQQTLLRAG